MFYFKKIVSYFDYYENHEKKKNCGYGKILIRDEEVTLEIHIRGLGMKESRMCDICVDRNQKTQLGRFVLDKGTGYYNARFHSRDMDGNGLSVFDINGLFLPIDENKYCETYWEWGELPINIIIKDKIQEMGKERMEEPVIEQAEEKAAGERPAVIVPEENTEAPETEDAEASETEVTVSVENAGVEESDIAAAEKAAEAPETEAVEIPKEETEPGNEEAEPAEEHPLHKVQMQSMGNKAQSRNGNGNIPVQDPLYADKWKQLCSQYPVCHPFEDGEEYISIAPKDFIILRKEYQNLVSNSFLLHSFYNYHHVILGKAGKDDGDMYYIGVPGNYLDREKRVAVMFGFEGFARSARGNRNREVQRQDHVPVETGAFGYYMRKVEI